MGLFPKQLTGFFFLFCISIFIYFFKYETIETHARTFLTLNILAVGTHQYFLQLNNFEKLLLPTYFREIESSAALIESFTTASSKKGGKAGVDPIQKSLINVRGQLQKAEEKIQELEENVKDAEDAARSVKKHFFLTN